MKKYLPFFVIIFTIGITVVNGIEYPKSKKMDHVDDYFGVKVADPYRWLEELNSDETKGWINEQNDVTMNYLKNIPFRSEIRDRLTELWNYEKYSSPYKVGKYYVFYKNDGLQEQDVVYIQKGLDGPPEVLIDPNTFSHDGSVSLQGLYFSHNNQYCGYGISRGGSDWTEFFVLDMRTKTLLPDHIEWSKFSGMSWYKDGFYYSGYAKPTEEEKLKAVNEYQKVYYHKLGTQQSEDKLIFEDTENPRRNFIAFASDDEKYIFMLMFESSAQFNTFYFKHAKDSKFSAIVDKFKARYYPIDNIKNELYVLTDDNAAHSKVIKINLNNPGEENWQTVIPESDNVINDVSIKRDKLIVTYLKDANSLVSVFDLKGQYLYDVELPGIGVVNGFAGKIKNRDVFYTFTSFTSPTTIYKYDVDKNKSELFKESKLSFDKQALESKQVFFKSKDGTQIPLFLVYKKGLELNGENPALLYGYGGFKIAMQPSFRLSIIPLLENGVVYALACLRGGDEYGEGWHKAGMLENKQNVFDDFIAAAEYLVENKYTKPEKLGILGGSNGGLLVGAVINQRPDLFKVALPAVGVMDMLRFHKFTIGWAWVSEYGSSDNNEQFHYLYNYSPLHNIKMGQNYPATLVTTADHDDRVFPAHSFKYIATLQEKQGGANPVLIRIETKVGHGAGTSTSKTIELYADQWSFFLENVGIVPKFE